MEGLAGFIEKIVRAFEVEKIDYAFTGAPLQVFTVSLEPLPILI